MGVVQRLRNLHAATAPSCTQGLQLASVDAPLPLTEAQCDAFTRDGAILVRGLIPAELSARAERAMWHCTYPDGPPTSWEGAPGGLRLYNEPDLKNCFTPTVLAAAAQLTGDDISTFSKSDTHPKTTYTTTYLEADAAGEDVSRFFRWDCAYCINIFPGEGDKGDVPHIDHSVEQHRHRTFPPVFRLGAIIYLSDVGPGAGGTRIWPGSHRELEAMACRAPQRYEWRAAVMAEIRELELGKPLELRPRRGDVLFLHHLTAHAGSYNASDRPRFAINMKW